MNLEIPIYAMLTLHIRSLSSQKGHLLSVRDTNLSLIDRKLKLVDKKDNVAGLQIADLVVTPIGRWAMGKKAHEDWEIIKTKFRKDSKTGRIEGYGLIALPKD